MGRTRRQDIDAGLLTEVGVCMRGEKVEEDKKNNKRDIPAVMAGEAGEGALEASEM